MSKTNRLIYPYERMDGKITTEGSGEIPFIEIDLDTNDLGEFEGTLTAEQLETLKKEGCYIKLVSKDPDLVDLAIIVNKLNELSYNNIKMYEYGASTEKDSVTVTIDMNTGSYNGKLIDTSAPFIILFISNVSSGEGTLSKDQMETLKKDNVYIELIYSNESNQTQTHFYLTKSSDVKSNADTITGYIFGGVNVLISTIIIEINEDGTGKYRYITFDYEEIDSLKNNITDCEDNITTLSNKIPEIITISTTPTATQGTITINQLSTLQSNDFNIIEFNNELYTLMDKGHTAGYLTYSHVGIENDLIYIKTFTITTSTRSWVLNIRVVPNMEYNESTKTLNIIG